MAGKGDKRRKPQVSQEELDRNWELAFGKKGSKPADKKVMRNK